MLGALIWSGHRGDADERDYQTRVLQAAADWTGVLINMNVDNVDASMQKLHDGTVGELNADFDAVDRALPRGGQDAAVAHHRAGRVGVDRDRCTTTSDAVAGQRPPAPRDAAGGTGRRAPTPSWWSPPRSVRTPATSRTTVRWNLRLGVSDVDGKLMISRLESLR